MTEPLLTVVMSSYNQASTLRQAVESVLMQKTDFPVRLILTDDHSTKDDSVAIIKEYAAKHPDRITALLNDENGRYLKNVLRAMAQVKSDYFTLLDADDYWTDDHYLADAVKFLEAHDDFTVYFRNVAWENEAGEKGTQRPKGERDFDMTFDDVVGGKLVFPQTTGAVFRNVVYKNGIPPKIAAAVGTIHERAFDGDVFRFLLHLREGKAHFENKVAGVYRIASTGVFAGMPAAERNKIQAQCFIDYYDYFKTARYFFMGEALRWYAKSHTGSPRVPHNGLLSYTYNDGKADEGYYAPKIMNIGDYIQSLAARQFLSSVEVYVDRDQLGEYAGEPVNMIMNAWYRLWRKNRVLSPQINPLMIGVHLNNPEDATDETIASFKCHEPIGCRDYHTVDFLKSRGVAAYFSGCLTLTLGETYRAPERERTTDIYFVDYRLGENEAIDKVLYPVLNARGRRTPCYYRSHYYPLGMEAHRSLQEAEALVREYARAGLVITRDLHCALPCLALGTPVVFVMPTFDATRFDGLLDFLNHVGFNEKGEFVCQIKTDAHGRVENPSRHLAYAESLERIASSFGGGGDFAGVAPVGTPAATPRKRYPEAERETGFWRFILPRRRKHG